MGNLDNKVLASNNSSDSDTVHLRELANDNTNKIAILAKIRKGLTVICLCLSIVLGCGFAALSLSRSSWNLGSDKLETTLKMIQHLITELPSGSTNDILP